MEKKSGGRKRLVRLFRESVILTALSAAAEWVCCAFERSLIGSWLTGYDRQCALAERGLFGFLRDRLDLKRRVFAPVKRTMQKGIDRSRILTFFSEKIRHLIAYPVKVYGVFLLSFGLYATIAFLLGRFALDHPLPQSNIVCGVAAMIGALPMLFSEKTLACAIRESRAVNLILFGALGVRREAFEDEQPRGGRIYAAFIAGLVLGIVSYFLSPLYLILGFGGLLFVYLLFCVPEAGVILLLFLLPFLPTMALAGLVILTAVCWGVKLIRGKRSVRFELMDAFVLIFMLFVMTGGLFSVSRPVSIKPAALYLCFIFGYFLVVNLIRTPAYARRAVGAVVCSAFLVSLYGIFEYFTGIASTIWQDEEMFGDISGRVVSTFGNPNVLAEYLVMVTLLTLAAMLTAKRVTARLGSLFAFGVCGVCLILTWSRGAWLGFICGVMLFLLICSRKTVILLIAGVCALPFVPFILPDSIIRRFTSIGNLADSSTAYRLHIWEASVKMARDFLPSGIGSGTGTFTLAYPHYSLAGIESAPHSHSLYFQVTIELGLFGLLALLTVLMLTAISQFSFYRSCREEPRYAEGGTSLAASAVFSGLAAVLVQGLTDYIWYNYRIFLMFWLMIGLMTAIRRTAMAVGAADDPDPGTSLDLTWRV